VVTVDSSRGHGYQVRAVDDSENKGARTYEKLSPLPKLRGLTYQAASDALKKGGFTLGTTLYHTCSNDKPGIVIDVRSRGVVALGWQVGLMVSQK
jgi:beta-lactam-binding protein with PASTA domain